MMLQNQFYHFLWCLLPVHLRPASESSFKSPYPLPEHRSLSDLPHGLQYVIERSRPLQFYPVLFFALFQNMRITSCFSVRLSSIHARRSHQNILPVQSDLHDFAKFFRLDVAIAILIPACFKCL